ncbi:MAG: Fic family protein [Alphaproteobacteria bacterium]|nr:MAG: Fic family protein [Alphaproteobacteria bacterium]
MLFLSLSIVFASAELKVIKTLTAFLAISTVALLTPIQADESCSSSDLMGHPDPSCGEGYMQYRTSSVYSSKGQELFNPRCFAFVEGLEDILYAIKKDIEFPSGTTVPDVLLTLYLDGNLKPYVSEEKYKEIERVIRANFHIFDKPVKNIENDLLSIGKDFVTKTQKIECVKEAANVHLEVVKLHPFKDGNGRYARKLLRNLLSKYCGKSLKSLDYHSYRKSVENFLQDGNRVHFQKYIAQNIQPKSKKRQKRK